MSTEQLRALADSLVTTAAKLIRASYDNDPERMAAALGNGSMAVKAVRDKLTAILDAEQDETTDDEAETLATMALLQAKALEDAAGAWSDWDALEAPEDWLRARAQAIREGPGDE